MIEGVETRHDGTTLVILIPMHFQRRGGRKRIVAPDGADLTPTTKPRPDGTPVNALARAWRGQRMLDEGVYVSVGEIAAAEGINRSYVSRVLRLTLLAPDVVECLLDGRNLPGLAELLRPFSVAWEQQRADLLCLRTTPDTKAANGSNSGRSRCARNTAESVTHSGRLGTYAGPIGSNPIL